MPGPGRIADLTALAKDAGFERPLLVTDSGLASQSMIVDALDSMSNKGLDAGLFSAVSGNPDASQVAAGVKQFQRGHDSVIAIGGGSALDVGKAIAFMSGQQRPLWDFEDYGDNWKRADAKAIAPVIAIPTTAGTGSEVGRATVISDARLHRKVIIFHPGILPIGVILDPQLTVGLPPAITAATGLDAFVHCFEAWCSPGFHPMADSMALHGIRLIAQALPRAFRDGSDIEARMSMQVAASMGAMAFQKGLGMVHAIAHAVGALYNTHHGLTNAVLLPYVMQFNRTAIAARIPLVAEAIGLKQHDFNSVYDWVIAMREELRIPQTLDALGVRDNQSAEVGELAAADPSAGGNPMPISATDCSQVFLQAVEERP